jgi:hypothetical protein
MRQCLYHSNHYKTFSRLPSRSNQLIPEPSTVLHTLHWFLPSLIFYLVVVEIESSEYLA